MKNKVLTFFGLFIVAVGSLVASDFAIQVTSDELSVVANGGEKVVSVPQGTVGKQVNVGGSEFLLSFGKDVRGNLSAILSPVLNKNTPLTFTTLNKSVKSDGNAIISIRYSSTLSSAEVDGGFIGRVTVADLKGTASESLTPAALMSDVKPMPFKEKEKSAKEDLKGPDVSVITESKSETKTVSSTTSEQGKGILTVLKEEGIQGIFDPKNTVTSFERSKKSQMVSTNKFDIKKATPMGGLKIISPELLASSANDKPGEIRLLDVKGTVLVDGKQAVEGALISQKSLIKTEDQGSAVAVVGGLHLVTIYSQSSISIAQELKEKKMETLVDLKSGTIFADVQHRKGITQDFKVKTDKGIVSATGSKALILNVGGKIVTIAYESTWKGTDSNGKPLFSTTPSNPPADTGIKILSFSSIPAMSGAELEAFISENTPKNGDNIVVDAPGSFKYVSDPVLSYLTGNSPTLPDGSTNPGSTLEGSLRNLILSVTNIVDAEGKDIGDNKVDVGGNDSTFILNLSSNSVGGRNGSVSVLQPGDTTPVPR